MASEKAEARSTGFEDAQVGDEVEEVERLRERVVKLEGLLSEALDDAPGWILDAEAALGG